MMMIQQTIAISEELDGAGIRVMVDHTGAFVLLLHFYRLREMACFFNMDYFTRDRNVEIRAI